MKISLLPLLQATRRLALPLLGAAALGLSGCVGAGFDTVSYRGAYYDDPYYGGSPYYGSGAPYYYGGGYDGGTRVVGRPVARPGVRKYYRGGNRSWRNNPSWRGNRAPGIRAPRQAAPPQSPRPAPAPTIPTNRR